MKKAAPNIIFLLAVLLFCLLGFLGGFSALEKLVMDEALKVHARERALPDNIVLVDIDQKSLEDMNELAGSWPWPRAVHAELIEALERAGSSVIVFDLLLNEPDSFRPDSDAYFAQIVASNRNVYLPTLLMSDGVGAPVTAYPEVLQLEKTQEADPTINLPLLVPLVVPPEAWRGGLINFLPDDDGIGRRYLVEQNVSGWLLPSMPKRLADDLGWTSPESDSVYLNWFGKTGNRYSYSDVFFDLTSGSPQMQSVFVDKLVIVGPAAPGLGDLRPTPLGKTYQGVLMLATAIANFSGGDWLEAHDWGRVVYPLLALFFLFAWFSRLNLLPFGFILLGLTFFGVAAQYAFLLYQQKLVHFATPVISAWLVFFMMSLLYWWQERNQRKQAISLFGRFLDPRVVKNLVQGDEIDNAQSTQSKEVSILFSDIRGFTSLSEKRSPEQVVALLNDYFSRQVEVIFRNHGTLDKFIGDAIMAFWGAPADNPRHALDAVNTALAMVEELERFRLEHSQDGLDFDVGIGIHTGPAVVGFIGSKDRLDYTAIGDSVNLSSRIEGATKGVARILVSDVTMQACQAIDPEAFDFIDHGDVQVKGRQQSVRLYEPKKR